MSRATDPANDIRPDFPKLRQAAHDARELLGQLTNATLGTCREKGGCFEREERRTEGLRDGVVQRSYSLYDPERLCRSCRAYWFTEMAALSLEHMTRGERQIAAAEGRELEVAIKADRLRDFVSSPAAEVLIDPDKYPPEVRQRARALARQVINEHRDKRDHHASVVAFLSDVVR